jgi:fructose-specific phosphotransferase system IIC component
MAALPAASEILVYGVVAGLAGERVKTFAGRYGGLVMAMVAGRVAYAIVALIALARPVGVSVERVLLYPWPGIALQLVALPIVATLLARAVLRPSP